MSTVTLPLKVENLEVAAHGAAHVSFSYRSTFDGSLVQVDGMLTKYTRGVGVVNVKVDRLWYAVPAGTLVEITTGEI
jgi:hypothetical protein